MLACFVAAPLASLHLSTRNRAYHCTDLSCSLLCDEASSIHQRAVMVVPGRLIAYLRDKQEHEDGIEIAEATVTVSITLLVLASCDPQLM